MSRETMRKVSIIFFLCLNCLTPYSLCTDASNLPFTLCTGYKHASPAVDILFNKLPRRGVASKRAKRLRVEVKYARRVHFGTLQVEVEAEVEVEEAEAAASKISEDQRHFNSKALRCCLPMQTINTTGHTGREAAQGSEEADEVKRARSCSMHCPHLPCSALPWLGLACLPLPAALWAVANAAVPAVA